LDNFIQTADTGLNQPIKEGDYTGLVKVMGHVMAVKDRTTATDEMFDPLKDTIELLKSYSQEMPENVYLQLQVCQSFMYCMSFTICYETVYVVSVPWFSNHAGPHISCFRPVSFHFFNDVDPVLSESSRLSLYTILQFN